MDKVILKKISDKSTWRATRDGFSDALVELGKINPNVVVLSADLTESSRAKAFKKEFSGRFFQFGVAEQNMMGAAAGMALCGLVPFVCTYGVFSTGRCWDQLRMSVCYSDSNVKIEGGHAGLMVGPDGASHQALEDLAITRVLPNITVVSPCDSVEARKATIAAAKMLGPVYIRVSREKTPVLTNADSKFIIGKAEILNEGKDVAVFACGIEVFLSILAAKELEKENISVCVINNSTIKPLDKELIIKVAKTTRAVVVAEEHQTFGGMGSAVCEVLAQSFPVPIEFIGVNNSFGESGEPWELIDHFNLNTASIVKAIRKVLKRKSFKNAGI